MDGLDPPAELELFNSSCRGHCFKRQNYLNDLQSSTKRSKGGMEDVPRVRRGPAENLQSRTLSNSFSFPRYHIGSPRFVAYSFYLR
uniref:Uncharacterized protein n=1 Tax=Oreochromis aureus TaxID=47969 RepID=A0AAZ1XH36_OREAU